MLDRIKQQLDISNIDHFVPDDLYDLIVEYSDLKNLFDVLNTKQQEVLASLIHDKLFIKINSEDRFNNIFVGLSNFNKIQLLSFITKKYKLPSIFTSFVSLKPIIEFLPNVTDICIREEILKYCSSTIKEFSQLMFVIEHIKVDEKKLLLNQIPLVLANIIDVSFLPYFFFYLSDENRTLFLSHLNPVCFEAAIEPNSIDYYWDYFLPTTMQLILKTKILLNLDQYIKTAYHFRRFISLAPEEDIDTVFFNLKNNLLEKINDTHDLSNVLFPLNNEFACEILSDKRVFPFIPKNWIELKMFMYHLSHKNFTGIVHFLDQNGFLNFNSFEDFVYLFQYDCLEFKKNILFEIFKSRIINLIKTEQQAELILKHLSSIQKVELIYQINEDILYNITYIDFFIEVYLHSTIDQQNFLFDLVYTKLRRLYCDEDIINLIKVLSPTHFEKLYKFFKPTLKKILLGENVIEFFKDISYGNIEIILFELYKSYSIEKTKIAYQYIWDSAIVHDRASTPEILYKAANIFNDYTKNNSYMKRLVFFHSKRHHCLAANHLLIQIQDGTIECEKMLKDKLISYVLSKPDINIYGSFVRRLGFILFKLKENDINSSNQLRLS